jgi:ketosteroid isomerase-like protein
MGDPVDAAELVRATWSAYAAGDRAAMLEFFAQDVAFAVFIPQEVLPFGGGETFGKGALSDRLQTVGDQFYILRYEGSISGVSGDCVRGQIAYCFKHKSTGEVIEGVMRQVFDLKDGKIVRLHEFHDVERIRAFMRLVSHIAQG